MASMLDLVHGDSLLEAICMQRKALKRNIESNPVAFLFKNMPVWMARSAAMRAKAGLTSAHVVRLS
ncbi:hypothetical protein N7475_006299 [Penicillium sp. IBT 31633x]|nr:hypothetical protein N7475_006299 [Penicillium sp. IBT 31633x]